MTALVLRIRVFVAGVSHGALGLCRSDRRAELVNSATALGFAAAVSPASSITVGALSELSSLLGSVQEHMCFSKGMSIHSAQQQNEVPKSRCAYSHSSWFVILPQWPVLPTHSTKTSRR